MRTLWQNFRRWGFEPMENLRDLKIEIDYGDGTPFQMLPQMDCSCQDTANVRVIFHRHKEKLLKYIDTYDSIVGCVAWLTDYDILEALATKKFVSIIVQKEDFSRLDINSSKNRQRELYDSLPESDRFHILERLIGGHLSVGGDSKLQAIRCMGNHKKDKDPVFPCMHHKFLVFTSGLELDTWTPTEKDLVWTGSYNLTHTAKHSLENTVVLQSSRIVEAYMGEWAQIVVLSEPLDWENPRCKPEWRIIA